MLYVRWTRRSDWRKLVKDLGNLALFLKTHSDYWQTIRCHEIVESRTYQHHLVGRKTHHRLCPGVRLYCTYMIAAEHPETLDVLAAVEATLGQIR